MLEGHGALAPPELLRIALPQETKMRNVDRLQQVLGKIAQETGHCSTTHQARKHPLWLEAVAGGEATARFIFASMAKGRWHWWWPLMLKETLLVEVDVIVPPTEYGQMDKVKARYLEWGKKNGFIEDIRPVDLTGTVAKE